MACKIILSALTNGVVKITPGKDFTLPRFGSSINNLRAPLEGPSTVRGDSEGGG